MADPKTPSPLAAALAMAPYVETFVLSAERLSSTPGQGAAKRDAVLELVGSVYQGAARTGALDGVRELRGVDWSMIAPLVALLIDGFVKLCNVLGRFRSSPPATASAKP